MFGNKSKPEPPEKHPAASPVAPRGPRLRVPETARKASVESAEPAVAETVPFEPRREEKQLIVGKGIVLKGEVSACDRLVVEGRVEASLKDSDVVVIAEGGEFKVSAEINEADVSGSFDGSLIVRKRLLLRASGRIDGEVRYGELEVERGGRITGTVQTGEAPRAPRAAIAE